MKPVLLSLPFLVVVGCGDVLLQPADDSDETTAAVSGDVVCDQTGCISQSRMLANISTTLSANNNKAGYAFAVGTGKVTGGLARTATDSPPSGVAMSTSLISDVASVSKIITTIAVLQSLGRRGISLDAPISPYLWPSWTRGSNIASLTFRDLLTQRSGFRQSASDCCPVGADGKTPTNCNATPPGGFVNCGGNGTGFGNLQALIAQGVSSSQKSTACYNNCNFAMFRELLPVMEGNTWTSSAGDQATWSANLYVAYVNQHILAPLGIGTRSCQPSASGDILDYPNPAGSTAGTEFPNSDGTLGWTAKVCGGGGWFLTLDDLLAIATDLATGGKLLTPTEKATMFNTNNESFALGWDNTVGRACPAPNLCKNGGLGGPGAALWAFMGIFKCSVPVVGLVNSTLPTSYQANGGGDIIKVVSDAYNSSSATGTAACCDGSPTCGSNRKCCVGPQQCSNGACCAPLGTQCLSNDFCCSGRCTSGVCTCNPVGTACSGASCCGGSVCSNGICALSRPPTGCNGESQPPTPCSAGWHCCGTDGWECGVCQ